MDSSKTAKRLRVDLHSHTWYSGDSVTTPAMLVRRARAAGLDRIAVTDHGTLDGALEARAIDPELVIVGEEISCAGHTHLIGLFLTERIPNRLSIEESARRIREQGGIVYAPHPYAYATAAAKRARRLLDVADVAEVFNARGFLPTWNRKATAEVKRLGLPGGVGSDAHLPWEVGRVYLEMPYFDNANSFLAAIAHASGGRMETITAAVHLSGFALLAARTLIRRGHGTPLWNGGRARNGNGPAR